jgi:hypothetical protein
MKWWPNKHRSKLEEITEWANTRGSTGGLIKRIDENRELLEFLIEKAPDFLWAHPWVIRWIESNDEFFTQLDEFIDVEKRPDRRSYPRPWPFQTRDYKAHRDELSKRQAALFRRRNPL